MHPITHLLASWMVANTTTLENRDRAIVTLAGVSPDFDGAGIVAELATRHTDTPLLWWSEYHHVFGHNLIFALVVSISAAALAKRRLLTAFLSFLVLHLHLLCDLIGSRGPDGFQWPIPYFFPFSSTIEIVWSGQWALNAWPNIGLTIILVALTCYLAWKRGFSPLEIISKRADNAFVKVFRNRFGSPQEYSR
jgi:inner membrane protein